MAKSSTATTKSSDVAAPAPRAKALGPSPRAQKKAQKGASAASGKADEAEAARIARNAYTRAWRAKKKAEAGGSGGGGGAKKRPPYPDTVEAPRGAQAAGVAPTGVVLTLPIEPGTKATAGQVKATLALMTQSYRAKVRASAPGSYERAEGVLTGLEMAKALLGMMSEESR
jgi:hypothetical protein